MYLKLYKFSTDLIYKNINIYVNNILFYILYYYIYTIKYIYNIIIIYKIYYIIKTGVNTNLKKF